MEEAEAVCDRIAIIDHGKIVAMGSPAEVKASQNAQTLEDAFLALTGHSIREEDASSTDRMRTMMRGFQNRKR